MATPDVRVRLSAEGTQEVISAFRQVQREAAATGTKSAQAFKLANAGLSQFKTLLGGLGAAAAFSLLKRGISTVLEFTDALDDMAAQLGVTTDFLQEMQYAAVTAGTPVESLNQAFAFLSRQIDDAAQKGQPLVKFLDGTSIAATNADGTVRGLEEVLADVVRIFPRVAEGAGQAGLAADLFGAKVGTKMVPLLRQGSEGLAKLRQEAHDTGSVLSEEFIKKGGLVNNELELLATRLQIAFASGLLEFDTTSIDDLHRAFTDPKLIAGVRGFGEAVQEAFGFLVKHASGIERVLDAAAGAFAGGLTGNPLIAAAGAVAGFTLGPSARRRLTTPSAPALDDRRVIAGATFDARPKAGGLTVVDPAAAAKAEAAASKAAAAAEREQQARQQAQQATAEFEAKLLEQQGHRHEAEIAALNLELATYEANLQKRGDLDQDEIDKRVADARTIGETRAEFAQLQRDSQQAFDDIAAKRAEIEQAVASGVISEQEGQNQIIALDRQRLGNLTAILTAMQAIAAASKDPEVVKAAQDLGTAIGNIKVETNEAGRAVAEFRKGLADAVEGELATFFTDIATGTKSASEAFKDLVSGLLKDVTSLIAKQLAKKLVSSLFGGGESGGFLGIFGVAGKADGGYISGPGTGRSDSIPAMLSNGEFVMPAHRVAEPGALSALESFRHWGFQLPELRIPRQRFAAGGLVGPAERAGSAGGADGANINVGLTERQMRGSVKDLVVDIMHEQLASERWGKR